METKKSDDNVIVGEEINTETGVAVLDPKNVPAALNALDEKIKSLKKITDSNYRTPGKLEGFNDLKTETLVPNLVRLFSVVLLKRDAYEAANAELGITNYAPFEINGCSLEDWKHDVLLRKAIIEHQSTLDTLTGFKEKLSKFLSEEDQKASIFGDVIKFLKGL